MAPALTREHLACYLRSLPESQQGQAGRYVRQFMEHAGDSSEESLDTYFAWAREHYRDSTVRYIWGVLHRFFALNGLPWPKRRSDTPTIREGDVFAPILDRNVVEAMIERARVAFPARLAGYLAISTIYGCRRCELAGITSNDIDIEHGTIYIATRHLGRERYHLVPEAIIPVLDRFRTVVRPISLKTLDRMFRDMEASITFEHIEGLGWHSIRRAVDYGLVLAGVKPMVVMNFMRWKRSESNMPMRYARGTIIGWNSREAVSLADREVDELVFAVHPFLPAWTART